MIATDTVFVLGAGASVPFRFPTGAKLREMLCAQLHRGQSVFELLRQCDFAEDQIVRLHDEFERSGVTSIDAFIAFRPKFQRIGELAIAAILVPIEDQQTLTSVGRKSGNSDWYQMLWNEMLTGVAEPKDLLLNRISFVSFNYDRSLEQYLLNAISSTFGLDQQAAYDLLSQLPIQHVYGSLGAYTPGSGYRYGGHKYEAMVKVIINASQSIKTIPATRGPRDEVSASWLAKAQRVFVMGFGFDPSNCARIDLRAACSHAPKRVTPRHIFASAFNLTDGEKNWCAANSCVPGEGGLIWTNGDCLALLRDRKEHLN